MSSNESALSAVLSKVKYRHADLTRRDCMNVMHHYRGLIPKQDKFTFNDGLQRDLITLSGTIPVPYKGLTYNIPVSVWLLDTHPYNAPLCYVKPTQDMQIKVSKHVDTSGKIYLPYLHEWAYPNSDLIGLIQVTFYRGTGGTDTSTGTITQEHIKASILSAVEDKVRRRIHEEFSTHQAEGDSLKKIGEDLNKGKERLEQMMMKLKDESADLEKNINLLTTKQSDFAEMISKLDTSDEIDVDDAVQASAPLYRQLLTAYAEESATEDALYFLGDALRRGVVDCDVFLKHVRNLSRRQFMLRATMQKCREKAGLVV
ncbi:tumor susceptibility gene 101 protein [Eurytemora carolleeae]|uniref:tumor susceptibility gene 101 protein n=1 Tax=Eurytemora carolleeae TaxID=1294199 RepID=UPI000C76ABEE|nr:tumor susceptibility gene 101 protein [Eurytemora carolleeae]|eukprot:XP_023324452.1 tumor susceptibility gene 101 protein-like [Eurytemora affinis]